MRSLKAWQPYAGRLRAPVVQAVRVRGVACLPASADRRAVARHELLLAQTFRAVTGRQLVQGRDIATPEEARACVWGAPFCILSHGIEPSPVMNYGNAAALAAFELSWDQLIQLESTKTAPPMRREERENLLVRVRKNGYIENYSGIRVSSTGKLFTIEKAIVWELHCPETGDRLGQAATFRPPQK